MPCRAIKDERVFGQSHIPRRLFNRAGFERGSDTFEYVDIRPGQS